MSAVLRVLIVDDMADVRELIRCVLTRDCGLTVIGEACDGADAVRQARCLQPDVVLLDLAMPVMDGLEALPQLRRDAPGVVVIVLTGFDADSTRAAAMAAGAAGVLEKADMVTSLIPGVRGVLADESAQARTGGA